MRVNINYSQVSSAIKNDWETDEIPLTGFSSSKDKFQIAIQRGLQGKQYSIDDVVVANGYAIAKVNIE